MRSLVELRKLLEATTQGEWEYDESDGLIYAYKEDASGFARKDVVASPDVAHAEVLESSGITHQEDEAGEPYINIRPEDAAFITEIHNDFPAYLDRLEQADSLRTRLAEAEGAAAKMRVALEYDPFGKNTAVLCALRIAANATRAHSGYDPGAEYDKAAEMVTAALSSSAGRDFLERYNDAVRLLKGADEFLDCCVKFNWDSKCLCNAAEFRKRIDAYLAGSDPTPPQGVTYTRTDRDANAWQCSGCECVWTFTCGGPTENKMRFCPECGKPIAKVVEAEDLFDDEDPGSDNPEAPGSEPKGEESRG